MPEKQCVACKKNIDAEALKCHWCKQQQNVLANLQNRPMFAVAALIVILLVLIFVFYEIFSIVEKGEYNDEIATGKYEVRTSQVQGEIKVSCFSDLTNKGKWKWDNLELKAEFYSESNELIDIHTESYARTSIRPNKSIRLRVSGLANASSMAYANCKIQVLDAR